MKDFEKKMERLEQIAEKMRNADIPLEQSFRFFEEGISLARELKKELDASRARWKSFSTALKIPQPRMEVLRAPLTL